MNSWEHRTDNYDSLHHGALIIGSDQNFNCKKIKIYRIFKIVRSSVKIRTHTRAHVLNQPTLPYLKVIIFFVKTIRTLNESESESESVILETISALWMLKSLNFDGVEIVFFLFCARVYCPFLIKQVLHWEQRHCHDE